MTTELIIVVSFKLASIVSTSVSAKVNIIINGGDYFPQYICLVIHWFQMKFFYSSASSHLLENIPYLWNEGRVGISFG